MTFLSLLKEMLPSLCDLSLYTQPVNATLFDQLIQKDGSKKSTCWFHSEDPAYEDENENCAIEGYLMVKNDLPEPASGVNFSFGNDIEVETPEGLRPMRALLNRESLQEQRYNELVKRHEYYMKNVFDKRCVRGETQDVDKEGNPKFKNGKPVMRPFGITFENFKADLAKYTDWYFIDEWPKPPRTRNTEQEEKPHHRGHLFVRLYDTEEVKKQDAMPHDGVCEAPYVFIILVCSSGSKGFGTYLMDMAYKLAYKLGCKTIALASLSNAAGFYYKQGFRFASRGGEIIDLKGTEWEANGTLFPNGANDRKRPLEE